MCDLRARRIKAKTFCKLLLAKGVGEGMSGGSGVRRVENTRVAGNDPGESSMGIGFTIEIPAYASQISVPEVCFDNSKKLRA